MTILYTDFIANKSWKLISSDFSKYPKRNGIGTTDFIRTFEKFFFSSFYNKIGVKSNVLITCYKIM